ncbi:MAG: hypothetical protein DRO67_06420 [Candidatus Asgardarchaeum californiense]|nr:MAG: hypothetical protein DRO67_06420 [Candidatus Asgardarchaeum californiense]
MDETNMQMALDYIDKIAEKLGTTASNVWPWFVRQQIIDAITSAIFLVVSLSCFLSVLRFMALHWRLDTGYSICHNDHEPVWVLLGAFLLIISVVSIISGLCEIPAVFNPEYAAVKDIMSMIK